MASHWFVFLIKMSVVMCFVSLMLPVSTLENYRKGALDSSNKPKCTISCVNIKPRSVCGSDGITYMSKCALKRAKKCDGRSIRVLNKGKCRSRNRIVKTSKKDLQPEWIAPRFSDLVQSNFPLVQKSPGRSHRGEEFLSQKSTHISNCIKEREFAIMSDMENPSAAIFIPRCQENGLWGKGQCHTGTNYCWCVNQNNGKPLPRTATYNADPKCDAEGEIPIKGCSIHDKQLFLADLLRQIQESFKKSAKGGIDIQKVFRLDQNLPIKEQCVHWFYKTMDKDGNSVLDRKEQKIMKTKLPKSKNTRKCSRNFLRYCDLNKDHSLTLEEWLACADITAMTNMPRRRTGQNPLSKYLSGE